MTNGIFIVVGGTWVANHQVDRPRIVGMPRPSSVEAVAGSVATTAARAWISPPSVWMRTPSPALRVTADHVDTVLDGLLEAQGQLVGQRLHAQGGQRRASRSRSDCMPSIANW